MAVRNYRDLVVWQRGMDLVEMVYKATASFPQGGAFRPDESVAQSGRIDSFKHC